MRSLGISMSITAQGSVSGCGGTSGAASGAVWTVGPVCGMTAVSDAVCWVCLVVLSVRVVIVSVFVADNKYSY